VEEMENSGHLETMFKIICKHTGDASAEVRNQSRLSFGEICTKWPERDFYACLDLTTRKQMLALRPLNTNTTNNTNSTSESTITMARATAPSTLSLIRQDREKEREAAKENFQAIVNNTSVLRDVMQQGISHCSMFVSVFVYFVNDSLFCVFVFHFFSVCLFFSFLNRLFCPHSLGASCKVALESKPQELPVEPITATVTQHQATPSVASKSKSTLPAKTPKPLSVTETSALLDSIGKEINNLDTIIAGLCSFICL
jgi:hypothetical protein